MGCVCCSRGACDNHARCGDIEEPRRASACSVRDCGQTLMFPHSPALLSACMSLQWHLVLQAQLRGAVSGSVCCDCMHISQGNGAAVSPSQPPSALKHAGPGRSEQIAGTQWLVTFDAQQRVL